MRAPTYPKEYVPESYSRQLDALVSEQEMPYGYTTPPPPADTGDYNQKAKETREHYFPYKK